MIEAGFLTVKQVLDLIPDFLSEKFAIDKQQILRELLVILKNLKEDIILYYEFPYIEKYYRDTYYYFYSKKHIAPLRYSLRISIFSNKVNSENFFNYSDSEIKNLYFGFITLRPTSHRTIGYTFISPIILKNNNFICCLTSTSSLVRGRKISTVGFPFSGQDNEAILCAETTVINLLDYFGSKYSEYKIILPSQISKIISSHTNERQLPSKGLSTENISFILKKLGFGTKVYSSNQSTDKYSTFKQNEFKDLMLIYVDSGIPIIARLTSKDEAHAILIIGRKEFEKISIKKGFFSSKKRHNFSELYNEILVMNDNYFPYQIVEYDSPGSDNGNPYKFDGFIVPLHPKVHIDASQFKEFFNFTISNLRKFEETSHIDFINDEEDNITRFFLTSSRSYKNYLTTSPNLSASFKTLLINKTMPKFIWVAEIIDGVEYSNQSFVKSIIVADATESGNNQAFLFATNSNYLVLRKEVGYIIYELENNKEKFYTFTNNLKGTHTSWKS